jgi:hypothetical protein
VCLRRGAQTDDIEMVIGRINLSSQIALALLLVGLECPDDDGFTRKETLEQGFTIAIPKCLESKNQSKVARQQTSYERLPRKLVIAPFTAVGSSTVEV